MIVDINKLESRFCFRPSTSGGGRGECLPKFDTRRLRPVFQPFVLLHTIFDRKGTPFGCTFR